MADLTALKASVAKLANDVAAALANQTSQAEIDAVTASVDAIDATVVPPAPTPAP